MSPYCPGPSGLALNKSNILTTPPPGDHVPITGSQGRRVYLLLKAIQKAQDNRRPWLQSRRQLLTVPFSELKAAVEEEVSGVVIVVARKC